MTRLVAILIGWLKASAYFHYGLFLSPIGWLKSVRYRSRSGFCVELGSGPRKRQGFVTIDCSVMCDVPWDLRLGLPFKNGTVKLIYSEHVFEHFEYTDLVFLLKECFRVLEPGGVCKISVPDVRWYIKAYCEKDDKFGIRFCQHKPAYHFHTPLDYLNYMFYMNGEHRMMFDEENLTAILLDAGAMRVSTREFEPQLDREVRRHESLLMSATK